jgi:hypothetical protein
MLVCDHYRLSRGRKKTFKEGQHQMIGTTVQAEHGQYALHCEADISIDATKRRKVTSVRAASSDDRCPFAFTIFCSAVPRSKGKWFVAVTSNKYKDVRCKHRNHLPLNEVHLAKSFTSIPDTVKEEIKVKISKWCICHCNCCRSKGNTQNNNLPTGCVLHETAHHPGFGSQCGR